MAGDESGEARVPFQIGGADIGVNQRDLAGEALGGGGQGVVEVAAVEVILVGNTVGMGGHVALEHEDLALRQQLAQMVVGAAVTQAQLKHRPGQVPDLLGNQVQAGALRLEAAKVDVQAAHGGSVARLGARLEQLRGGLFQTLGQNTHDLDTHFRNTYWYKPSEDYRDTDITDIEKENVRKIIAKEQWLKELVGKK